MGVLIPITAVVILCAVHTLSAPTERPQESGARATSTDANSVHARFSIDDYVVSDAQYQQLLDELYEQASGSLAHDPSNYVSNNASIEEILRLIEEANGAHPSTTSEPTTRSSQLAADFYTQNNYSTSESPQTIEGIVTGDAGHHIENNDCPSEHELTDECAICLDPLNGATTTFQCGHTFHTDCIGTWACQYPKCPMCRKPLRLQSGELLVAEPYNGY